MRPALVQTPPSILIVEQSEPTRRRLAEALSAGGFDVREARDVHGVEAGLQQAAIRLVLLDVELPGGMGLWMCRRLAERDDLRIIALGASTEEADRVLALELGADDYVPKTSGRREIAARVRALLRRAGRISSSRRIVYEMQDFRFDAVQRRLQAADGTNIPLTPCQASLLAALLQASGRALTRPQLLACLRGDGIDVLERAIDSHVSRLRARLAAHGGAGMISTVQGRGYQWSGGQAVLNFSDEPPAYFESASTGLRAQALLADAVLPHERADPIASRSDEEIEHAGAAAPAAVIPAA
jgi:two-component system OmpR family response regulator